VLGDFLASYELVPGTVVHGGCGALWERLDPDPYRATARAFFFKASSGGNTRVTIRRVP
jgi:hypothetical protein